MEQLEKAIQMREAEFTATAKQIINQPVSNSLKIKLIYQQYVNCMSSINTLVTNARIEQTRAMPVSS